MESRLRQVPGGREVVQQAALEPSLGEGTAILKVNLPAHPEGRPGFCS